LEAGSDHILVCLPCEDVPDSHGQTYSIGELRLRCWRKR
jgi:hypothetical protein